MAVHQNVCVLPVLINEGDARLEVLGDIEGGYILGL